jgi:hypothetical protein
MLNLYIKSIGITAPGMNNWQEARQIFSAPAQYSPKPLAKKLPTLLPPNESRRASRVTQLAISAALQTASSDELQQCLQVFSSSNGDLNIFHRISQALSMAGRPVSPTLFHNSVHNAPAGYWSIATKSQAATTSISAAEATFSAALLEAVTQVQLEAHPVLLVAYDAVPPATLKPHKRVATAFAVAMLLVPGKAEFSVTLEIENGELSRDMMSEQGFEFLRQTNPASKCLPLLEKLARKQSSTILLPYLYQQSLRLNLNCHD